MCFSDVSCYVSEMPENVETYFFEEEKRVGKDESHVFNILDDPSA